MGPVEIQEEGFRHYRQSPTAMISDESSVHFTHEIVTTVRHLAPQSSHAADNPSIVWVQWERGLRLTRVRGVPRVGEASSFSNLGGVHLACSSVATVDSVLPVPTGHS